MRKIDNKFMARCFVYHLMLLSMKMTMNFIPRGHWLFYGYSHKKRFSEYRPGMNSKSDKKENKLSLKTTVTHKGRDIWWTHPMEKLSANV